MTRVLRPLTELPEKIREHTEQGGEEQTEDALGGSGVKHDHVPSEATSVSQALIDDQGVVLDANREVRVKLYIGQVLPSPSPHHFISAHKFAHRSSSAGSGSFLPFTWTRRRARRSC